MPPLTPANQLIRSRNVTASEVGALLGEHPYQSPGSVWDRLTGYPDERPQSEAMHVGTLLEPVILRLASERLSVPMRPGPTRLIANSRTFVHHRVRLAATPDAMIVGPSWHGRALVELKASGSRWRWEHGLPDDVVWQCRAQMACAKRDRVIVIVLVGVSVYEYVVERQRGPEQRMLRAVDRFWNEYVMTGIRPPDPVKRLEIVAG